MQKNEPAAYGVMLCLSLAFSILAVVTLLPNPAASKPNVLGYRSVCSFAPTATALCGLLAGITCTVRNRLVSRSSASMRYRPLILPIGVGLVLVTLALVFGIRFGTAQASFGRVIAQTRAQAAAAAPASLADGTRSATVTQGEVSATVEVTIHGGRIDGMRLSGGQNVDRRLADVLFKRVMSAGNTDVDAVSGATASSKVLLKAVADAASGS